MPETTNPPRPKRKRRYDRGANGVYVVAIDGDPTKGHIMRWTDPETGERGSTRFPGESYERVNELAEVKRLGFRNRAADARQRKAMGLATRRRTIASVLHEYYDAKASPVGASEDTVVSIERSLWPFLQWCEAKPLVHMDELNQTVLREYYNTLRARRMKNGKLAKPSTINQLVKPLRAALHSAGEDLLVSQQAMRIGLPHVRVMAAEDRELHGITTARSLEPDEIPVFMRTVRAYDARPESERRVSKDRCSEPCAVDLALTLLYGPRRDELVKATVADIQIARSSGDVTWSIHGKGRRKRAAWSRGYTVLGAELLKLIKARHKRDEWVSENDYGTLGWVMKRLRFYTPCPACDSLGQHRDDNTEDDREQGRAWVVCACGRRFEGLNYSMHDLRATCATAQMCLDVDIKLRAARLGHRVATAESHYLHPHPDWPARAKTLEEAMGISEHVGDIIAELLMRDGGEPRLAPRPRRKTKRKGLTDRKPLPRGRHARARSNKEAA